jgi:hypothetical protein
MVDSVCRCIPAFYPLTPLWLLPPADFTYLQVSDAAFPGLVEKGFAAAAACLWPGIQKALETEVVQGSTTAVTISGHSLGAALATLIAYRAQVRELVPAQAPACHGMQ